MYETEITCKLGYFKDEIPPSDSGGVISEFVGLKSKLYSIKTTRNEGCRKRAKGVKKTSLDHITHQDYLTCLFDYVKIPTGDMNFRSYAHKIYTIKCKRTSIHSYDDKRYILEDNIKKMPYGHYKIVVLERESGLHIDQLSELSSNMADAPVIKRKYKLTETKTIDINFFKRKIYYHFSDVKTGKIFTLSYQEISKLFDKSQKLLKIEDIIAKENLTKELPRSDSDTDSTDETVVETKNKKRKRNYSSSLEIL